MRLDLLLHARYPDCSRSFWKRRIEAGDIRVRGKKITKVHTDISEDAAIEVKEHIPANDSSPSPAEWKILYEHDGVMVIDKPPYIRVEHLVLQYAGWKLAHRLDKNTSGILVLARSEKALDGLQQQWKARTVKKEYTALVKGALPREGRIEGRITRSFKDRKKMAVGNHSKSREATTEFECIKTFDDLSLVRAKPLTGRTHQIRVHFASIHHPIVGDTLYGNKILNAKFSKLGLHRQFLHASALQFEHPRTHEIITIKSDLPEDLQFVILRQAQDDKHF